MARLKFLVFALIALGLWGYHFTQVGPLAVQQSMEQANAAIAGATGAVALTLEAQRSAVQAIALKVVTTPGAIWNAGPKPGAKPEAPTADRFAAVRSAAQEAAPEAKEELYVAVVNDVGSLSVKGSGEPATTPGEGIDFSAIGAAGAQGLVISVDGTSYLAYSVPLAISDKNEVRQGGSVVIGLPALGDPKGLEAIAKSLQLHSLALVSNGKPIVTAGDAAANDEALAKVKANSSGALRSGAVRAFGPLELPMMADSTTLVGGRHPIAGTNFEIVASASSRAGVDALAAYQMFAISGLVALFLLTIVFTIIMGGHVEEGGGMSLPPPMPVPPKRDETGLKPAFNPPAAELPPPPVEPPPPEASPDDFDFPPSGNTGLKVQSVAPPPPFEEPTSDPFASAAPPPPPPPAYQPPPPPPPAQMRAPPPPPPPQRAPPPPPPVATTEAPAFKPGNGLMDDDDEGARTVAYPAFKNPAQAAPPPAADPFALAAAQESEPPPSSFEDNPDATRVAAVPAELIKAARAGAGVTGERPALKPATAAMPKVAALTPAGGGNEEERHFQEVFRDFVATREKCREPADGLTFDKFKTKLLKNKEQLVAKYQCRTVRFQVYVKDGKAALKATPVKD
ncbi:MAG: MXAN_5187 C-terminal domain-containing protein [Myxococcaceae bacterium]